MKKLYHKVLMLVLTFFIFNSSFLINNCQCQWVQVSGGMISGFIYSLASNSNTIFVGTDSHGVYLSTNNGINWTQTTLNSQVINALGVNGNYIFAGTVTQGVYLSSDNGANWSQTSLNSHTVWSLAVNGNDIFAGAGNGGSNGLYLSTNNGTNWNLTSLNNAAVVSLAINGNNIFAGSSNHGLYFSINNGVNWTQALNLGVTSLCINGNNIFAGTVYFGVYMSTNNGANWSQTSLNVNYILSLESNGNNIFAGTGNYGGIYVSNNNGTTWTLRNEGLNDFVVDAFCLLNNYIYAGTYNGIYRRPLNELIGIQPTSSEVPNNFSLSQNYPNPFNPNTKIRFSVPLIKEGNRGLSVKLVIYDMLGKEAATLVNQQLQPGTYEVEWSAANYPSGVYYYKLISGEYTQTKKMVLIK